MDRQRRNFRSTPGFSRIFPSILRVNFTKFFMERNCKSDKRKFIDAFVSLALFVRPLFHTYARKMTHLRSGFRLTRYDGISYPVHHPSSTGYLEFCRDVKFHGERTYRAEFRAIHYNVARVQYALLLA